MKISIAMATYNGAKYLSEQLASLAAQKHLPFELVACDDGSSDQTITILNAFSETAPFPVRIYQNDTNLGFADNFLKAARLCQGDWVAFCDQDDVWLDTKLRNAGEAIQANREALMILQNCEICDENMRSSGRVFPEKIKPGYYRRASQYGFWVWPGFLKTFRRDVFSEIPSEKRPINYNSSPATQTHDKWTCMIANALGGIAVLGEPVARYRRHPSALTGSYDAQKPAERILKSIKVKSEDYEYLAEAATSSSLYLKEAAQVCENRAWKKDLLIAANDFDDIGAIQSLRFELYQRTNIFSRLNRFIRILLLGGYWGRTMIAMGWKSAAKDMVRAVGLIGS